MMSSQRTKWGAGARSPAEAKFETEKIETDMAPPIDREGKWPSWIREVDIWFLRELYPFEASLVRTAWRILDDPEASRDLVHEVYAEILKGERWRGILHPRAYAMMAVRRTALRTLQRARVVSLRNVPNMEDISGRDLAPDAYQVLDGKEQRRFVMEVVEALPARCRQVVKMRRFGDRTPHEIATVLGISVSTVDKHLAHGMAIIARRLAGQTVRD